MAPALSFLKEERTLIVLAATYILIKKKKNSKRRRKHRWWVHPIVGRRREQGAFHTLVQELHMDDEKYQQYFRVTQQQFGMILSFIEEDLIKRSRSRDVIRPKERLAVCLRYLATGESFHSLGFCYRIGVSTVSKIVSEVCYLLWERLQPSYMKVPNTKEEWKQIARYFEEKWQFPHCLGAIDGKHVVLKCPDNSGSLFFNYKGTFSTVLMALVDANLQFIAIDIGAYGRNSDGGIFSNSNLGKGILQNALSFPEDEELPTSEHLGPLPYVVVGDEAFPLHRHIMRPYPGKGCPEPQQIFNYRLSRARRIVENAFGVLASRWRLYNTKIAVRPDLANAIVKATCILHNLIQSEYTPAQLATQLGAAEEGRPESLRQLPGIGNRAATDAMNIRESFTEYFCNVAPVSWQEEYVRRGKKKCD